MTAKINTSELNAVKLNNGGAPVPGFETFMRRKHGSRPITKVELIETDGTVHDLSEFHLSGGNFEQLKERAPDEIQAGEFDIIFSNAEDTFSELVAGSLFSTIQYHGAIIRISQGFIFDDGSEVYEIHGVGYIDQLTLDGDLSKATFRCRDIIRRILDQKLHSKPAGEIPIISVTGTANGKISQIATKPFSMVTENWVITCTTPGGNGVALFSVVGSVSGNVGTATSGTEFSTGEGAGGIKFTISAGTIDWDTSDLITFSTSIYPQWDEVNAGKIIWSILTGYNWDSDTQEGFSGFVFDFDRTQTTANVDIDYNSFVEAISDIEDVGAFNLKGYIPYDTDAVQYLQQILLMFLGSIFTGSGGKMKLKSYIPVIGGFRRLFSDDKKISVIGYTRTVDEIINKVVANYKEDDKWEFSDAAPIYDGVAIDLNAGSISEYNEIAYVFDLLWFTQGGGHAQDFASKLLSKFADPPLNINFTTGLDALRTEIGDIVIVKDDKYGIDNVNGEVTRTMKTFEPNPVLIEMTVRRDGNTDIEFGFIGSEIDEGDGISPQADDFDSASDTDKIFAYFGSVATSIPDYRIF